MRSPSDTRRGILGALVLTGLLLQACGGGGSSSPAPTFNATGYWQTWLTDPSTGEEEGPFGSYLLQNGAAVDGVAVSGTVAGNALSIDVVLPGLPFALQFQGAMSGMQVSGIYAATGLPLSAAFRMLPFSPTGLMTANGTVGGVPVNVDTTTAFGQRDYADEAHTVLTEVSVVHDDGTIRFELAFDPGSLTGGVLDASADVVQVYATNDNTEASVVATSGTVTIIWYDASGFAATFDLMLPGAESITGSFDVAYDIEAYDP